MKFEMSIESNNYAFTDTEAWPDGVLRDLLRKVAGHVTEGFEQGVVLDPVNGRQVGSWTYTPGETE